MTGKQRSLIPTLRTARALTALRPPPATGSFFFPRGVYFLEKQCESESPVIRIPVMRRMERG